MLRTRSALRESTDAELVSSLADAPEEVLVEVYRRHADAIRSRALRVLGDGGLADGVVQEVVLRFWQRPESFDPNRGSLHTYLCVQARCRAIEQRRSSRARAQREHRSGTSIVPVVTGSDVEQEVVDHLVAERLHRSVAGLPDAERVVIEAAYFDEHSYRAVAELLGRPEGTVKTRIRSGLGHLRAALDASATGGD